MIYQLPGTCSDSCGSGPPAAAYAARLGHPLLLTNKYFTLLYQVLLLFLLQVPGRLAQLQFLLGRGHMRLAELSDVLELTRRCPQVRLHTGGCGLEPLPVLALQHGGRIWQCLVPRV